MKDWQRFYNRQLNRPDVARLIEQRELERELMKKRLEDALLEAAAIPFLAKPQWSDCEQEPWSKQ